ncbi:hypothetical protein [Aeromicrobium sp. 179-A 4D2 NHS]|uniref:hypothetical protein n=1 Tax=Aeromicrobium sp. 179-A 4D2 NHS TaxID=3142375 RepID=UPI0039A31A8C
MKVDFSSLDPLAAKTRTLGRVASTSFTATIVIAMILVIVYGDEPANWWSVLLLAAPALLGLVTGVAWGVGVSNRSRARGKIVHAFVADHWGRVNLHVCDVLAEYGGPGQFVHYEGILLHDNGSDHPRLVTIAMEDDAVYLIDEYGDPIPGGGQKAAA